MTCGWDQAFLFFIFAPEFFDSLESSLYCTLIKDILFQNMTKSPCFSKGTLFFFFSLYIFISGSEARAEVTCQESTDLLNLSKLSPRSLLIIKQQLTHKYVAFQV